MEIFMRLFYKYVIEILSNLDYCFISNIDLSGQILNDKHIIKLVELLLRHPEVTSLNLSDNGTGDDGATALAEKTTLAILNLSDNEIGDKGAIALAGNHTLTALDLSYNQIGYDGAIALEANTIIDLFDDQIEDDETDQGIVWYVENRFRKRYEALKWSMQQMLDNQHNWQVQQVPNTKQTAQEIIQQHKNIDNVKSIIEGIKAQNNLLLAFVGAGRSNKPLIKSVSGEISKFFLPDLRRKDLRGNDLSDNGLHRYENTVKRHLNHAILPNILAQIT